MSSEEELAEDKLTPDQREIRRLATDSNFRHDALRRARNALRKSGQPEPEAEAEDVYQEAMNRLFRYLSSGSIPAEIKNPRAYLFKMIINEVRRLSSKEKGLVKVRLDDVDIPDYSS